MQKGFTPIFILIGLLIAGAIAGGAFYLNQTKNPEVNLKPIPTPLTTPIEDETANWKTYESDLWKFLIKYPSGWSFRISPSNFDYIETISFGPKETDDTIDTKFSIQIIRANPNGPPKNAKDVKDFLVNIDKPKDIKVIDTTIDGKAGFRASYTDLQSKIEEVIVDNNELIYTITFQYSGVDTFYEEVELFNQILSTFKFLNQKQVKLFYYNSKYDPNQECVVEEESFVQRSVSDDKSIIEDTIDLLINGGLTETERSEGFSTEFPKQEFKLLNTTLDNGILTLEFSEVPGFTRGGACRVGLLSSQIIKTAMQFPEVKEVKFKPETLFQP